MWYCLETYCSSCQVKISRQIMPSESSEIVVISVPQKMLKLLCRQGRLKEALQILHNNMEHYAESSVYVTLLQSCVSKKAMPQGKIVHAYIIQTGLFECQETFLLNNLLTLYAKCGSLADARRVLSQMADRDVVSWTAMITVYAKYGCAEEALALFNEMRRSGIEPDHFTFSSLLPVCTDFAVLKLVHEEIIRSGFHSDGFVGNALVDMYAKCGYAKDARDLFDKMPQRNVVSWNAMIAGYVQNGCVNEALKLFQTMPERDEISWTAMIAGYAQNGYVDEALKFFLKMPNRSLVSWNAMIAGYVQNGFIHEAMQLFQKMPRQTVESWNAMIAGYAQNGHGQEALNLFEQMQVAGMKLNAKTFASALPACASLAALDKGMEIHEKIAKSGFETDIFVASALVHMYAKCGSIDHARNVFDKMCKRDVVSWTAMIEGYAIHGCGKEALELFEQMQRSGVKPNHITLVGILSACCHAGLVEEGRQYFDCMSQHYHITPRMEHYACMVDLLGRAGRLDEAQDFIDKMPIKPDATVWRCLLGACRAHKNVELGKRVAEYLFELDPDNASPYLQLANIYATAGRWDGLQKVRKLMNERQVKKKPGCSWIEVNKQVYAFLVGDSSMPQAEKTQEKVGQIVLVEKVNSQHLIYSDKC